MVFRNGVSWSQSSVFRFLKMWLDRFSYIALKLTLGLQNLCSSFRFALFIRFQTSLVVISVIKCLYLFIFWVFEFLIFVSNGTVSSKISIFYSILSIITRSGFCHKEIRSWGTVLPPRRVWDGMSAYIKNRSISINPVIYWIILLGLLVGQPCSHSKYGL